VWNGRFRSTTVDRQSDCPTCAHRRFEFLDRVSADSVSLCGRRAVQVRPTGQIDFASPQLDEKLRTLGEVERTRYLIRCRGKDGIELTLFPDGRLIVHGTNDPLKARSLYSQYIGS
jgi:hypothetical protein